MFRWVFIEIELDLFVDYKTSFAFVLATDAVSSSKHYFAISAIFIRDPRRCIVSSLTAIRSKVSLAESDPRIP